MSLLGRAARALSRGALAQPMLVALLALVASATSLVNGFVYDDRPIISTNPRVQTLGRWWELFAQPYWPPDWGDTNYRPLTILSFAVQWAIGDGSPVVFHVISVVLYLVCTVAVLYLARLVLPHGVALVVAALFAVHPVHVEAVGNVVGQAEIVVAICIVLAATTYVRWRLAPTPSAWPIVGIAVAYVVACFSKETGFFLPGVLVAAELTVVTASLDSRRRAVAARARELRMLCGPLLAIAVGYLAARRAVLGGFGDDPNTVIALLGHKARLLTMLNVVPEWVRLLLWPTRLAADYSPADIAVVLDFSGQLIGPALVVVGLSVITVAGFTGRRVAAFGLLWTAVTLFPVSNLVLRSGVIVAERTLFLPSVGALLAVGAALAWADRRARESNVAARRIALAMVAVVVVLGATKSARRQRVWRSSDDFLRTIVLDAPRGYRAHYMHGMWHFEHGRRELGERHVRTAIALFPYDAGPYIDLGDQYREAGICHPARDLYRKAIALGVLRDRARLGLVACLLRDGEFATAREEAQRGLAAGGRETRQFRRLLAVADSAVGATSLRQTGRVLPDRPAQK